MPPPPFKNHFCFILILIISFQGAGHLPPGPWGPPWGGMEDHFTHPLLIPWIRANWHVIMWDHSSRVSSEKEKSFSKNFTFFAKIFFYATISLRFCISFIRKSVSRKKIRFVFASFIFAKKCENSRKSLQNANENFRIFSRNFRSLETLITSKKHKNLFFWGEAGQFIHICYKHCIIITFQKFYLIMHFSKHWCNFIQSSKHWL